MSKEHAYAYDAGYRDGSINYELEHCPACKNVADLQEALAENDRLRERITTQKQTIQSYRDESREWREVADHAQADNTKLRELVRDYIDAPCTTCDCWQDEFRCWNYDGADCGLVERARELGVEVD